MVVATGAMLLEQLGALGLGVVPQEGQDPGGRDSRMLDELFDAGHIGLLGGNRRAVAGILSIAAQRGRREHPGGNQ